MKKSTTKPHDSKVSASSVALKPKQIKILIIAAILCAVALFSASGYYWYKNVFSDPDRVLNDVLNKSLQTTSVDRTIKQDSGQSKLEQSVHLSFTPNTLAQSMTQLDQSSQNGDTSVITETVGTKDEDLVRYASIDIQGTNAKKQNFDDILNVWGERKSDPETGQSVTFLSDALFMAVPFGNLSSSQRHEVVDEIKHVGLYKDAKTKTEFKNGRPVITYTVNLDPQALVKVLAKYAKVTGVGEGEGLDPNIYEGAAKIPIEIEVDVLSRHINVVNFTASNRQEIYESYNAKRYIELPEDRITVNELQKRLSNIEQQ